MFLKCFVNSKLIFTEEFKIPGQRISNQSNDLLSNGITERIHRRLRMILIPVASNESCNFVSIINCIYPKIEDKKFLRILEKSQLVFHKRVFNTPTDDNQSKSFRTF